MSIQTISQLVLLLGIVLSAIGGFGSYYFGKLEEEANKQKSVRAQDELRARIQQLQASTSQIGDKTELIYQAMKIQEETWFDVEMKNVPPGVADYLLLLFTSDKGRISGKLRVKGSDHVASFSTTANNKVPVAVRNAWSPEEGHYKIPTVLQFSVTEKTEADASLSIYTQGWIDSRGTEPQ
jgi:hypothetical protein